ncbi:MAG TPA: ATP-binding protein [Prolixibacteraceae bacterium]|nr:ATP-binding protein [Prolixibacteraceae bacterium]
MMNSRFWEMIREGEHQRQDFKYCISDSRKIARSLVAFANTDGGSLLVGVKDNGHLVGVQSEEEYYMVESAARIYSKPPVPFTTKQWHIEGKTVFQVIIEPSQARPHYARDENGKWLAWIRHQDENRLASRVMIDVWQKRKEPEGILVEWDDAIRFLLGYLNKYDFITVSAFARKAVLPYRKAEQLLADFIVIGLIQPYVGENNIFYQLNRKFDLEEWEKKRSTLRSQ